MTADVTPDPLALTGGTWVPNGRSGVVWQWDSDDVAEVCAVDVGEQYELDFGRAS